MHSAAMKLSQSASPEIAGGASKDNCEFHAGFLHEWNDRKQVYGDKYERLMEVEAKYDPENRFNKGVDLAGGRVSEGTTV